MKLIPQKLRESQITEICEGTIYSFVGWKGHYKGNRTPLIMNCAIHGEWVMYMPDFFRNVRCSACKNVRNLSEMEVINKIKTSCTGKNFRFIRWDSDYKNSKSKGVFECFTHGEWTTCYRNITESSSGCPICSKNGFDISKPGFLYCLISEDSRFLKIGITNNLKRRIVELKRNTPFIFELLSYVKISSGKQTLELENAFHEHFQNANFEGFNGATEWLKWNPEIPLWLKYLNGNGTHSNSES